MKRRANEILNQPPNKITPKLTRKFEFLELSICATRAKARSERQPPKTARNAAQKLTFAEVKRQDFSEPITMERFQEILSNEGQSVKNVRIVNGNSVILPSVEEYCKNLKRIELLEGEGSLSLRGFRNLTEMKLRNVRICTHAFRQCLQNNPDLETLEYDHYWYENEFMDLSELLPNLTSLQLVNIAMNTNRKVKAEPTSPDDTVLLQLLESDTLTKFSFESDKNCTELLKQLSLKLNLEELHVKLSVTIGTFAVIGLFENLKSLALTHNKGKGKRIAKINWPPRLTRLHLNNFTISDDDLLSIAEQLDRLEELHIGTTTADQYPWLKRNTISEIENKVKLRMGRRVLKILFSDEDTADQSPYKHKSDHLEIINEEANEKAEPLQIMIAC